MFMKCETALKTTDVTAWSSVVEEIVGKLQFSVPDPDSFSGELELREIPPFKLAMFTSTPSKMLHRGGAFSENERFLIKTQISGRGKMTVDKKEINLSPGDFILCDNTRDYMIRFPEKNSMLTIPIPKKVLSRFHANPEELAFRKADAEIAVNQVLSQFTRSLWASREARSSEQQSLLLINTYFELLVSCFQQEAVESHRISTVQSGHLERCKAFIEQNLGDENLNVETIASEMGISKRYLYSVFSKGDMTVSSFIFSSRLDKSARMLRGNHFREYSVSEIAFDCGFKSAAHFSRAFKDRFDLSPSKYRKSRLTLEAAK